MKKIITILIMAFTVSLCLSFKNSSKSPINDKDDFIKIAKILYPEYADDIENCFQLFVDNTSKFEENYSELINDFYITPGESTLIDLLYAYGDSKNKVVYIDWRGEENKGEIEEYITDILNTEVDFSETENFRSKSKDLDQRDGEFILELFNKINEDLNKEGMTLAFFNIEWDAYGFTIISLENFAKIKTIKKDILN
ncbi:hypothetical protein ACFS5M_09800 [Lacinutrix iliipiscaria]|uniref:DUF6630 domain-containing protein n=1 Tax=Lacinutrix iliipiscaria TaxID=1230532 RepID=A0ABW5WPU0_9FLAO